MKYIDHTITSTIAELDGLTDSRDRIKRQMLDMLNNDCDSTIAPNMATLAARFADINARVEEVEKRLDMLTGIEKFDFE